jgi:hypothetical protein
LTYLGNINQRRFSVATQPCNNNAVDLDLDDHTTVEVYDDKSDATSIFNKFKKFGEVKRPGFM